MSKLTIRLPMDTTIAELLSVIAPTIGHVGQVECFYTALRLAKLNGLTVIPGPRRGSVEPAPRNWHEVAAAEQLQAARKRGWYAV